MTELVEEHIRQAIRIAHVLFYLGKTTGNTGNISFRINDRIYITSGGTCFWTLCETDFSIINMNNILLAGRPASKESPLHISMYQNDPSIRAIIHTHGHYSVLWSTQCPADVNNCVPDYTPYLKMKLGNISLIPYEKPGTEALFQVFRAGLNVNHGYILERHGAIVGAENLMNAFYCIEELEESCRVAWHLKQ